ncbi:MAG: hybrid sensor histidine kinase/response regulator [Methanocalculus sp. MSAO_Arc2]|uniref:ATP-binding response regulator n=1 Tax=Methanocalculus sp. MSAO_Arc2 TaxID=2293855 RepID=UPI000FF27B66|nr:MAG: hybrid sensor histidine kinase/response regulator [Methanocalculus sp. MSAO_Arc2]
MNPDSSAPRLLVVEDSPTQAEYIRRILIREGFFVNVASDGRSAIQAMKETEFDLVISDIIMPGMDGYELCHRIREVSMIPIILVTQLYDTLDIVRGLAAGADGFIIKPFDPISLLETVANMISIEQNRKITTKGNQLMIDIDGYSYTISAEKETILSILLSTYATAVNKNIELQEARDELYEMNEQLQDFIEKLRYTYDELHHEMNERQRMENAVIESHRNLQLMTSITRHDIRNQLAVIEGYLELAGSVDERIGIIDALSKIRDAGRRIERIIEFTRDFQEMGASDPQWQDLRSVIDSACYLIDNQGVAIISEIANIRILSDPLFERVCTIIIDNAIQHGESVTHILISTRMDGNNLLISFKDDGIGIPEELKMSIFEHGYGKNTGLGLFLAREILSVCDCTISECGQPGKGALFEILVPEHMYQQV